MTRESTKPGRDALALGFLAVTFAIKLWVLSRWSLLADEAYYARWSESLAFGYYDQPPLIAWVLASARLFGDFDIGVRVPALLAGALSPLMLWSAAKDRVLWVSWWTGIPALCWLTGFATPDAFLLLCWSAVLAGILRGGRGWWLAGAALGLGVLAKYTAVLLLPLWWCGRRNPRDPVIGLAIGAFLVGPHLMWLASNGAMSVMFQASEGWWHPHAPGGWGPVLTLVNACAVATPFAVVAGLAVAFDERRDVLLLATVPTALFFLFSSFGGPPEAHWTAPIWVAVGLAVSNTDRGWIRRCGMLAIGVGGVSSAALVGHIEGGLLVLPEDPAARMFEGPLLADGVAGWALPLGVAPREPRAADSIPVFTERYQEAALIWWYTGIPATTWPDCAREDQFDHWPRTLPDEALFVRPVTSGSGLCSDDTHPHKRRHQIRPFTHDGRPVGPWDLFEIAR